jgi:hypothetical protein
MVKRKDDVTLQEEALATHIPEFEEPVKVQEDVHGPEKISPNILNRNQIDEEGMAEFEKRAGGAGLGENIFAKAEAREGWITINRALLGERNFYYPEDWQFLVRPATVEVIRNWSMLDETNGNSIDDVFNEILKYCLTIKSNTGVKPWQSINNWDRFFFVLLIREYTFVQGESKVEFTEDCYSCESPVQFTLESQALMYEVPDDEVLKYYDAERRLWVIDPVDFEIPAEKAIYLYNPTIEKDANIKAWLIAEHQENDKKKFDPVFIKFLPWLCERVSKDLASARMQIRKAEMTFKSWDTEMFSFMNDVLKNISVTPSTNISAICPACGEEVVTKLRFPDGVGALFNVVNKRKKFGTK